MGFCAVDDKKEQQLMVVGIWDVDVHMHVVIVRHTVKTTGVQQQN